MIINLLVVFCIIAIIFACIVYIIQNKCPKKELKMFHLRGDKYQSNTKLDPNSTFGVFTAIFRLEKELPCGVYKALTIYGNILIFINKKNKDLGYIYDLSNQTNSIISSLDTLEMWHIERINEANNFLHTYNAGCC